MMISFSTIFLLASALREIVRDEENRNPTAVVSGENDEQTELQYNLVSEVRDANDCRVEYQPDLVTEADGANNDQAEFPRDQRDLVSEAPDAQGDRSWHRISQDLAGNMRESHRILQGNAGNIWNMEAVFPPGISRIFSDDFRTDPARKHRNLSESTEKNPENSRPEYCFQLPSIFRCIPAVSRRTSFTLVQMIKMLRSIVIIHLNVILSLRIIKLLILIMIKSKFSFFVNMYFYTFF